MTWVPQKQFIRSHVVASNLLAYIAANQADAILWANSGTALKPLKSFSDSVVGTRLNPLFPAIGFASDEDQQAFTTDITPGAYAVVYEIVVESQNPNTAVAEARIYSDAIKSMILNIPSASLLLNTGALPNTEVLENIKSQFSEINANEPQNDFFQTVQIGATYTFEQ